MQAAAEVVWDVWGMCLLLVRRGQVGVATQVCMHPVVNCMLPAALSHDGTFCGSTLCVPASTCTSMRAGPNRMFTNDW